MTDSIAPKPETETPRGVGRRDYEERRQARIARLEDRAARLTAEGNARINGAKRIADGIPFGQPILIGHHSEKRARRDAARIQSGFAKGFEALREADDVERRAQAASANTAVSSDDPEALEKLREKRSRLESERDAGKRINTAFRKGGWVAVRQLGFSEAMVSELERLSQFHHRDVPVPGYRFTNLSAEIRRVTKRIEQLEKRAARAAPPPETFGEVLVREEDNRVQIVFPGKPSAELRSELKSWGFRWSPSAGAWQRLASNQAWHWARVIATKAGG